LVAMTHTPKVDDETSVHAARKGALRVATGRRGRAHVAPGWQE